jgi:beta-mannosidase
VFNGLDTFTTIEVCGQIVGTTDNQFRQYTFEISKALENCKGDPTLKLNFGSAPEIANAIARDADSERTHHPWTRELEVLSLLTLLRVAGWPTANL